MADRHLHRQAAAPLAPVSAIGRRLMDAPTWKNLAGSLHLSPRELEVVQGVFDEGTEREIANHLGISHHTVHMYIERIYRKLGLHSHVGLVLRIVAERERLRASGRFYDSDG